MDNIKEKQKSSSRSDLMTNPNLA
jgi:hypothetical protein